MTYNYKGIETLDMGIASTITWKAHTMIIDNSLNETQGIYSFYPDIHSMKNALRSLSLRSVFKSRYFKPSIALYIAQ